MKIMDYKLLNEQFVFCEIHNVLKLIFNISLIENAINFQILYETY